LLHSDTFLKNFGWVSEYYY